MTAGGRRNLIFRTAPLRQAIVTANDDDSARPIGTGRLVAVETEDLTTGQNFDSWGKDPAGLLQRHARPPHERVHDELESDPIRLNRIRLQLFV
jgi:hypothetical protein